MPNLIHLLQHYGVLIVFAVVLIEQLGLPIPAFPILIVAGALAANGDLHWMAVLAAALSACLISDFLWFRAGRRYGKRILRLLCRISLSPDYCVSQTEDNFNRWGPKALMVSKFIPGFNTIAAPLSGAMGTSARTFCGFALAGGLLWTCSGVAIGAYFHNGIDQVLDLISLMGSTALVVLAVLLLLFIAFKYVERKRFLLSVQGERIGIDELTALIEQGLAPLLMDARSGTALALEPALPGAVWAKGSASLAEVAGADKERHIVVFCSCPNDVTAAQVAQELVRIGYRRARALRGGLSALKEAHPPMAPMADQRGSGAR